MNPRGTPTNLAASVRDRLRALARSRGVEFQLVLSEFATERLLFRLGISPHSDRFILKGATLFRLWTPNDRRATWDLDLLGRGPSQISEVVSAIRDLCDVEAPDGIVFDPDTVRGEGIRDPNQYGGVRVRLEARLAGARIPVQVDVGFGDAVVPSPTREVYPVLLDHLPPRILTYPRESVIAEKLEAMVSLGVTNTRLKDLYDLHQLATAFPFEGASLVRAVQATFQRRKTPLPEGEPLLLTADFLRSPDREVQWRGFLSRGRLDGPRDAGALVDDLRTFLLPVMEAAGGTGSLGASWDPARGWVAEDDSRDP
ncbi:MAG: nucleotidyl transferase AbiEii/AbiGii toxin family protein [Gemmatimonadota bacterium]